MYIHFLVFISILCYFCLRFRYLILFSHSFSFYFSRFFVVNVISYAKHFETSDDVHNDDVVHVKVPVRWLQVCLCLSVFCFDCVFFNAYSIDYFPHF